MERVPDLVVFGKSPERFRAVPTRDGGWGVLDAATATLCASGFGRSRMYRLAKYLNGQLPPANDPVWEVVAEKMMADVYGEDAA